MRASECAGELNNSERKRLGLFSWISLYIYVYQYMHEIANTRFASYIHKSTIKCKFLRKKKKEWSWIEGNRERERARDEKNS